MEEDLTSVSLVTKEHVDCGNLPIEGLGLSLKRAGIGVAASSTNAVGDVAFAVPPNVTGNLQVVVDAVPQALANVNVGDVVGSVQIAPTIEVPPRVPSDESIPSP